MRQAAPKTPEGTREEALALLAEIGEEINASLDLDEVLAKSAALIKRVVAYDIFAVLLLDEATGEFFFRFAIGHRKEVVENWRVPLGQGITGAAAASGHAIRVPDVRRDPRYINALDSVRSELAVPLMRKGNCIGVLDIQSPELDGFTREQQHLLTPLASGLAIAIENARLFERARRQADSLLLLNEVGRRTNESLELEEVLRRAAELTKRVIDYQIFSILLYDETERVFRHSISVKFGQNVQERTVVREGEGIVGSAARTRKPIVVPDVRLDPRYLLVNPETRSELAIPLISKSGMIGVLDLESPQVNGFTEEHVQALSILAAHLAVSIENARLYQRVAGHEERMESELEAARVIQSAILPAIPRPDCGLEIAARYVPARELGGDFYDFSPYGAGQLGIALGDTSGKGVAAALYSAVTAGIFRSLAPRRLAPGRMLEEMERLLSERQIEGRFTTFCFARWHRGRRELRLANAGQCEPLLVRPGRVETLALSGFPLGLGVARGEYEELRLRLDRGDTLILYSDGLTESQNPAGELFGSDRLRELVGRLAARQTVSPARLADGILEAIDRFTRQAPLSDDRALVVLKVK
jgi:sigma-B regulation protein RsbU (phosphoserine phosphatase)